jgi:hypothetical protein
VPREARTDPRIYLGAGSYVAATALAAHPFIDLSEAFSGGSTMGGLPIWVPFGAALLGAIVGGWLTSRYAVAREQSAAERERLGRFEAIAAEIRMCAAITAGYVTSGIGSPAYRLPLIGHEKSLAPLLATGKMSPKDCDALMHYYVNAVAFNRCLDACHDAAAAALNRGEDPLSDPEFLNQVSRAHSKASILKSETDGNAYNYAIAALRKHLPEEALRRLNFDASEPEVTPARTAIPAAR